VFDGQQIGMIIFLCSIKQLLNSKDEHMATVMESVVDASQHDLGIP
jgi:hypothetical protein